MSKYSFLFLLIYFFGGCNSAQDDSFLVPRNFAYPVYLAGKGKLYIYQNVDAPSERTFQEIRLINEKDKQSILLLQYSDKGKTDSSKISMKGVIEETYLFFPDTTGVDIIKKGVVIRSEILNRTKISKIRYDLSDGDLTVSATDVILKDTTIKWKSDLDKCLLVEKNIELKYLKKNSSVPQVSFGKIMIYYAEGIGPIKFISETNDNKVTFYLIDIKQL